MIGNALLLALRQIGRNPMRSLLTVLGVVIGVAAVITMVTIGNGATSAIRAEIESFGNNQIMLTPGMRLGPGQKIGAPNFKFADVEAIRSQIAGVAAVSPRVQKSITLVANGRNWQTSVAGTDSNYFTIDNRAIEEGRAFEEAEERAGASVCVIGATVARELFGRTTGVMKAKGSAAMGGDQDDIVIMPIRTIQRRIIGDSRVTAILILMDADSDRERLKDSIRELMRERRSLSAGDDDNFQIMDTAEIAQKVASTTGIMTTLLGAVAGVSLLVGGIGIMNIMLVSVTERTREIGIRLAIGALGREVLLQFLIEALMLGCLGGLLGVAVAFGASYAVCLWMKVPFAFDPFINALAFSVSALTGIVFGFFPARRAARLDPIEAVRHE